jgi:hypothetical protein
VHGTGVVLIGVDSRAGSHGGTAHTSARATARSRRRHARCLAAPCALPSRAMTFPSRLPPGFVVPAQPVASEAPPSGADWVHEIKHDHSIRSEARYWRVPAHLMPVSHATREKGRDGQGPICAFTFFADQFQTALMATVCLAVSSWKDQPLGTYNKAMTPAGSNNAAISACCPLC